MPLDSRNRSPQANPPCPAGSVGYTVGSGDSFYTIARRLGTSLAVLGALNPGVNPDTLQVGRQICVPAAAAAPQPQTCPGGSIYTIEAGDTYYTIAASHGLTVQALLTANPGVAPNRLRIGQPLCLPGAGLPQPPARIPTPLCSLLQPSLEALPPSADIPIGSVTVRQVAMSTRAYTIVAAPLPDPAALGNYNSYNGVLSLLTDDPAHPRDTVSIRLIASSFGNQLPTWAGTTITAYPPLVGDTVEIRPLNTVTGRQGPVLLQGTITPC